MKQVAIVGAHGRLGSVAQKAVQSLAGFQLYACLGRNDDLKRGIDKADIIIDTSLPECVFEHACLFQTLGKAMIVGASGLKQAQIEALQKTAAQNDLGGIIAPNFSIGALLMMQMAQHCAALMAKASIIEAHHEHKVDAPSGTALKTAHMMQPHMDHEIPIHALRMPGCIAEQTVRFGNMGETLVLEHRMSDRDAFIPGIQLACQRVLTCNTLVYGLESFLVT